LKQQILAAILVLISSLGIAQPHYITPEKPKLIVLVTIDNFRYDYLSILQKKLSANGLKRLINGGSNYTHANYEYCFTQNLPGFATLVTGAEPSVHGIVANEWYNPVTKDRIYACFDKSVKLLSSQLPDYQMSPKNVISSSFPEMMKFYTHQKAKVFSVALQPETAVLLAGRNADAAYYFETETGNFVSSGYYLDSLPLWVNKFNAKRIPDTYLSKPWHTLFPLNTYIEMAGDTEKYERGVVNSGTVFPYDLPKLSKLKKNHINYNVLTYTPSGNTIVSDFATNLIVNEQLGKDNITDFLAVNYGVTAKITRYWGTASVEMEDVLLRLDGEIAHFVDFLNDYVGKQNYMLVLTAPNGANWPPEYLTKKGFRAGRYKNMFSLSLLKSYLRALYGKGEWVLQYDNKQIFLNRPLIEDSKLSLNEVQDKVAAFLSQFSDIALAMPAHVLESNNFTEGMEALMEHSYNKKRSGDVLLSLEPFKMEDVGEVSVANSGYNYDTHVPLIFYGWRVKMRTIDRPVNLTQVAPALSEILDMEYPTGCFDKPLKDIY